MKIDVVMLSNTADNEIFQMTSEAIRTMRESDPHYEFNIILVETERSNWYQYPLVTTVRPPLPFNYNAYLNAGFEHLSGAPYAVICNNDLVFHEGWFSQLRDKMELYRLDLASPYNPGWPPHEEMIKMNASACILDQRTSHGVTGWCFCMCSHALAAIRPFDECFSFEWGDVDMVDQLKSQGYGRMGLVPASKVTHLLNRSHRLLETRQGMIEGAHEIYKEKQRGSSQ